MTREALVVLAEGFEEIEAVTPIDVLRRAGVQVIVAGVGEEIVTGSHGIRLAADLKLEDYAGTPDAVVLPGGMPGAENLRRSEAVQRLVQRAASGGKLIAAICASPAVALSGAGLTEGRTVTCYPGFEKQLPAGAKHSTERVVKDGSLLTSRGPGTALEFALALVRELAGEETARRLSEGMIVRTP
ncbi:MAG: Protein/nucleic acid deglycase 3 [Candidatus Omnitrophica bacterium]|nr:Protein/nucleic acid deglycase 3 [Candidatus Omnitrophota bacterium]